MGFTTIPRISTFLRVFAWLPQSVYSVDLRDTTIAHAGGDIYGTFPLRRRFGDFSFTVYAGHRSDSIYSSYPFLVLQWNTNLKYMGGLQYGGDLRWNTPVKGFLIGASRMNQDISATGTYIDAVDPAGRVPYFEPSRTDWTNQFYGQYQVNRFCFDAEYRRYLRNQVIMDNTSYEVTDVRGWYIAGTYQLNIGGTVRLSVTISPKETVEKILVLGGNPILAEAAAKAVQQWVYVSAPSQTTAEVTIPF